MRLVNGTVLIVALAVLGGPSWSSADETGLSSFPQEDEVRSRSIAPPRQLAGTVTFTITIAGMGIVDVVSARGNFPCPPTCSKLIPAGTPITLTARRHSTPPFSFFSFKEWQGCQGQITGSICSMMVPMNTVATRVEAVFKAPPGFDPSACGPGLPDEVCQQLRNLVK